VAGHVLLCFGLLLFFTENEELMKTSQMNRSNISEENFKILGSDWRDWRACLIYAIINSSPQLLDNISIGRPEENVILIDYEYLGEFSKSGGNSRSTVYSFMDKPSNYTSGAWVKVTLSNVCKRLLGLLGSDPEILGLPWPATLSTIGINTICLGYPQLKDVSLSSNVALVTAFPLRTEHIRNNAMQLALWLLSLFSSGFNVVRLDATCQEILCSIWDALGALSISSSTLESDLALLNQSPDSSLSSLSRRPIKITADYDILYRYTSAHLPSVSICISLYNYESFICRALDSCLRQGCLSKVELIIVDDCSQDSGGELAYSWLAEHGNLFARSMLISHKMNLGLANARNTAINASSADWFFILDADNTLEPSAIEKLFAFAETLSSRVAVVHPLIQIASEENNEVNGIMTLLGDGEPWQYHRMIHGNTVDAMALIRKSAWEAVSGYSHLKYGWEDFDFWCKLIEEGYIGVQLPLILAKYYVHSKSMLQSVSNVNHEVLIDMLSRRHPWLKLSRLEESD
jgi:GT2 family glycosyltransferase